MSSSSATVANRLRAATLVVVKDPPRRQVHLLANRDECECGPAGNVRDFVETDRSTHRELEDLVLAQARRQYGGDVVVGDLVRIARRSSRSACGAAR
jgi:hypothetical protein